MTACAMKTEVISYGTHLSVVPQRSQLECGNAHHSC